MAPGDAISYTVKRSCKSRTYPLTALLHTTRRMLEASSGRFQGHTDVNSDALLKITT
jgi:hypothetical protein